MPFNFIQKSFSKIVSRFSKKRSAQKRTATDQYVKTKKSEVRKSPTKPAARQPIAKKPESKRPVNAEATEHKVTRSKVKRTNPSRSENISSQFLSQFKTNSAAKSACLDCVPQMPTTACANSSNSLAIELGIDFGTRYTKVCFHNSITGQIDVVRFAIDPAEVNQALILSQIGTLKNGNIITGLTASEWDHQQPKLEHTIDFLKMRLAHLDPHKIGGNWLKENTLARSSEAIENLSAYFLSNIIIRSQYWIRQQYPDLFRNRVAIWTLNVGVPVSYCEGPATARFEKTLKIAWALSYSPKVRSMAPLTLDQLHRCVGQVRLWMEENKDYTFDCFARPEIAAAVSAHIQAERSREGFYVFFDVGDGTVEGAAFRYYQKQGEPQIDFYAGSVEPLGVGAFIEQLCDELKISPEAVLACLHQQNQSPEHRSIHSSKAKHKFQCLVASIVMDGCDKHDQMREYQAVDDRGDRLRIFVGGGGGNLAFYRDAVKSTHSEFHQGSCDIPEYRLYKVRCPENLNMGNIPKAAFSRFSIAYGLSIPYDDFLQFDCPDDPESGSVVNRPRL